MARRIFKDSTSWKTSLRLVVGGGDALCVFTKVLTSTSNKLKTAYRQIWVGGGEFGVVSCKSYNILLSTKKVTRKVIEPSTSNPKPITPFTYQKAATFYISTFSKMLKGEEEGGWFLNTC